MALLSHAHRALNRKARAPNRKAINKYLSVTEAAAFLGVHHNTLRNWLRADTIKIPKLRNPMRPDRIMFRREDLEDYLDAIGGALHDE